MTVKRAKYQQHLIMPWLLREHNQSRTRTHDDNLSGASPRSYMKAAHVCARAQRAWRTHGASQSLLYYRELAEAKGRKKRKKKKKKKTLKKAKRRQRRKW